MAPLPARRPPLKEVADWVERYRQFWDESSTAWTTTFIELQNKERTRDNKKTSKSSPSPVNTSFTTKCVVDAPRALVFEALHEARAPEALDGSPQT